jgi:glucuronate isomerase
VPAADGSAVETDGAQDLAALRREHLPLPRHADALWLDHTLSKPVRHRRAARRPRTPMPLRPHRRAAGAPDYRPRALFERFNIEVIATTEGALDDLRWHRRDPRQRLEGPVVTAYRPDAWSIPISRASPPTSTASARSPAATPAPGPAISTPIASAAPSSSRWARPRPTTATPRPRPPTSSPAEAAALFDKVRDRQGRRPRARPVPRPDADRDGADEPRRRAGAADPSRLLAQPFNAGHVRRSAATRASTSRPAPTTSAR